MKAAGCDIIQCRVDWFSMARQTFGLVAEPVIPVKSVEIRLSRVTGVLL